MMPSVYAWLYRNDKEWLQSSLQSAAPCSNVRKSRVDWHQRDQELVARIESLADQIVGKRLTRLQICALSPGLKPMLSEINQLPLFKQALQEAYLRGFD